MPMKIDFHGGKCDEGKCTDTVMSRRCR